MSNKEKLLASAQKNLQKGQIAKAIKDYQQVVQLDPRDIRNRQKLAELFCRAGMNAEALSEYGAVAKYYAEGGFYLKAIAVYKQMQKVDSEQLNIYHRLAELNVKQGLIGNALAEYRNLLAQFEKKRLLTDAIAVLQKMAELEPENLNFQVKITEYYAQAGLRDKARAEFDHVLGRLRENRDFSRMANLYEMLGPFFSDPEIKTGYAEALICKGEVEKGITILKNLLRDNSDDRQILMTLALGYREKKDFENERLTYQHLLKQAPGDLGLREGYIRTCLDGGEFQRALKELDEWKEAFCDAGNISVLKDFYECLLKSFPGNVQVQGALALIYEQTGEKVESPVGQFDDSLVVPEASERDISGDDGREISGTESEGVAVVLPAEAQVEPQPVPNKTGRAEESGAAEEIPLEFLQLSVESARHSSAESLLLETADPPEEEAEQVVMAEEMEFELELELDDPSALLEPPEHGEKSEEDADELALEEPRSEAQLSDGPTVLASPADDIAAKAVTPDISREFIADEVEPEELLEELEEIAPEELLEELEEIEAEELLEELEEIEADEVLLELEPAVSPSQPPGDCGPGAVIVTGEESLGRELRSLLAGYEPRPENANIRNELEEIEFYLHQGLLDDAEKICRQLLEVDPNCEEIKAKLSELEICRREVPEAPAEFQLFSLSAEGTIGGSGSGMSTEEVTASPDYISASLKEDAESHIDIEDTESHYNLGIAYKEMGLLDDALAEFDQSMKNPARLVDSLTLKGSCLLEKGRFADAEQVFRTGLDYSRLSSAEKVSLLYELGLLYEAWGRPLEALDCFQSSADIDLFFRNVGEKVEALRKTLGLDSGICKEDSSAKGNKSRVSYV